MTLLQIKWSFKLFWDVIRLVNASWTGLHQLKHSSEWKVLLHEDFCFFLVSAKFLKIKSGEAQHVQDVNLTKKPKPFPSFKSDFYVLPHSNFFQTRKRIMSKPTLYPHSLQSFEFAPNLFFHLVMKIKTTTKTRCSYIISLWCFVVLLW